MAPRWFDLPVNDWVSLNKNLRRLVEEFRTQGTWEDPMALGGQFLWVDSTGDLRINATAPTSDTDGTIVGTQS